MTLECQFTCEACPVQAEGTVDGVPFYFRARWSHWRMVIGDDPCSWEELPGQWWREESYGDSGYDAGWMPLEEAKRIIARCADEWRAEKAGGDDE